MALLAIPNVSEGRNPVTIGAVASALTGSGARLLDTHTDADHNRTVYTLAGSARELSDGLVRGTRAVIALNFELAAPADRSEARRIAALIREGGPAGLSGVRAIGIELTGPVAQVSTNIDDVDVTRPAEVLAAVRQHATVNAAEIVGLPPARYFSDFPRDLEVKHFRMLEEALLC